MTSGKPSRDQMFYFWKVIEGALKGDPAKVRAYAEHLALRLEAEGDDVAAKRLAQLLTGTGATGASLQKTALGRETRLPVDSESRLPVADEERWAPGSVPLVLNDALGAQVERFLRHFRASDRLAANGVPISPSMLLYGPPGTGKTQIARYIAAELGLPLVVSRSDALVSSYLGSTAKNVRMLFDHAAARPCVLFLDEVDAIAKKRDDGAELGELKRVVIGLLQNIDALGREHILIAATNHEHLLDSAVWRRFAYHIAVALPGVVEREALIRLFLGDRIQSDVSNLIATLSESLSGAQLRHMCEEALREAVLDGTELQTIKLIDEILLARGFGSSTGHGVAEKMQSLVKMSGARINQKLLARTFGVSQAFVSKSLRKGK